MMPLPGWIQARGDPVWVRGRACAGLPPNLFIPVSGRNGAYRNGQRVCAKCPVQELCAKYYLEDESDLYIAGMTPQQRSAAREARKGLVMAS
jgi:hypothetical protein